MPERTEPGDSTYTALHAKWVAEGSPGQFEERGSYGYRRWRAHFNGEDDPTFLLLAALGPTDTGYDEDTETFKSEYWPGPRTGSEVELMECGLEVREGSKGKIVIEMDPTPRDITI
jgi:hypothetical protein